MFRSIPLAMALVAGLAVSVEPNFASAQNAGNATADAAAGGVGGVGLNVEEAFSGIERDNQIGASGDSVAGFSDASVAPPGGGGGGLGAALGGFGGGFGGLGGLFGNTGFGSGQNAAQPAIRTRLRSAIEGPMTRPAEVQRRVGFRMQAIPGRAGLRSVGVAMDGQTAVLSGTVSSERDRRMSELLMRLEPGVRRVENRITVGL